MSVNFESFIDDFKYNDSDLKNPTPVLDHLVPIIAHVSTKFTNIPLEKQYALFEEYLLYFFNVAYKYNQTNIYIHSGLETARCAFRELSINLYECEGYQQELGKYKDAELPELILTIFYDPETTRLLSIEVWASKDIATEWGSVGFNNLGDKVNTNVLLYRRVLPIMKRVYDKIASDKEMHAWYILSNVKLETLLLDYAEV